PARRGAEEMRNTAASRRSRIPSTGGAASFHTASADCGHSRNGEPRGWRTNNAGRYLKPPVRITTDGIGTFQGPLPFIGHDRLDDRRPYRRLVRLRLRALADMITRIVKGHPKSALDELLPWVYAITSTSTRRLERSERIEGGQLVGTRAAGEDLTHVIRLSPRQQEERSCFIACLP
ncbi:transposase domain-containing protein, partial [Salinarimonas ramus]|uniref:transposase domain-containing protein n=1 Tax=Salinarimonas ramus TaxID=690164 RepID=UPI001AEE6AA3